MARGRLLERKTKSIWGVQKENGKLYSKKKIDLLGYALFASRKHSHTVLRSVSARPGAASPRVHHCREIDGVTRYILLTVQRAKVKTELNITVDVHSLGGRHIGSATGNHSHTFPCARTRRQFRKSSSTPPRLERPEETQEHDRRIQADTPGRRPNLSLQMRCVCSILRRPRFTYRVYD